MFKVWFQIRFNDCETGASSLSSSGSFPVRWRIANHKKTSCKFKIINSNNNNNNDNRFVAFYPELYSGKQVYQKKHSLNHTYQGHQLFFIIFLHLLQSILAVKLIYLTVFLHNVFSGPLSSTLSSGSGTFHFILHTFLYRIIIFFHNTCPHHWPVLL